MQLSAVSGVTTVNQYQSVKAAYNLGYGVAIGIVNETSWEYKTGCSVASVGSPRRSMEVFDFPSQNDTNTEPRYENLTTVVINRYSI